MPDITLRKHRICTTISQKHWELLKKNAEKFETQQKALEYAIESLEYNSKQGSSLSPEEKVWVRMGVDFRNILIIMHKDSYKVLMENSDVNKLIEVMTKHIPMEFFLEYLYGKPLRELSLNELIEAIITKVKLQNTAEMINYTDDGDHYSLRISHNLGLNHSKILQVGKESVFKKYGVKTESQITEKGVFMKIYKKRLNETRQGSV